MSLHRLIEEFTSRSKTDTIDLTAEMGKADAGLDIPAAELSRSGTMNYRANYVVVQTVHVALALLAFLYVADWAREAELAKLAKFFVLLPIVVGVAFVFYTNKIFYLLARGSDQTNP